MAGGNNGQEILKTFESYDLQTGACSRLPDMHVPRDELCLAALEGEVYAIGGGSLDGVTLRSVEKFSFEANRWEPVCDLLIPRRAHSALSAGSQLFVSGGFDGEKYLCSGER